MSITVELELPEAIARKARAAGLLDPAALGHLITREVETEAERMDFFGMLRQIRAQPGVPLTLDEIQAEVDAIRAGNAVCEDRR